MRKAAVALVLWLSVVAAVGRAQAPAPAAATAQKKAAPLKLAVNGDTVTILRDAFGVPHVYASTVRGLFYGNGYAVAEDRLWQLERYRHDARGRLAELEGKEALNRDRDMRRRGYTAEEYRAAFDALDAGLKAVYEAYRDGVNAYIEQAAARGRLPENYQKLGLKPAPWDAADSVAIGIAMAHRFGSGGGGELRNLRFMNKLKDKFGEAEARKIFNDLYWVNDPRSPTSITGEDMKKPRAAAVPERTLRVAADPSHRTYFAPASLSASLSDAALRHAEARAEMREALAYAAKHDLPTRFGSYAWIVGPKRTVSGNSILVGGPQMGFTTPQIAHEVHLSGAGYEVIGMGFAGLPGVLIGHNAELAWTTTSGITDMVDVFAEKLDPQNKRRYQFQGKMRDMDCRTETVTVRGAEAEKMEVCRTVHGPVLEFDEKAGLAYSLAASFRGHEMDSMKAFLGFNRAATVEDFGKHVSSIWLSHNFFAADRRGNIGFWLAGKTPLRPAGHDPRLPLPGTGDAEWRGRLAFEHTPQAINPARGYVVNWNNKPAPWYDNSDSPVWGEIFRMHRIQKLVEARPKHTVESMRQILADIGLNDPNADYLKPHLLAAVERSKTQDADLLRAADYLRAWDNHGEEESVGKSIFDAWLPAMRSGLFQEELGELLEKQTFDQILQPSLILHVLDGAKSGLPPQHDFLKGRTRDQVVLEALRSALATLRQKSPEAPDMGAWGFHGQMINFRPLAPIPATNRGTYIQIVELAAPVRGISILPPGQNEDPRSPHFGDQREPAALWRFKPMVTSRAELEK